jgi:co-chaperonin GroES (HSP10)
VKAIGKYIVVSQQADQAKTQGGLLISGDDQAQMRYAKGSAVSIGTDVSHIKEGDVLYYDKRNTHQARIDEVMYQIVPESCVVVVL